MTDQDLALLEQITYIDKNVLSAAGINSDSLKFKKGDSVEKVLKQFTPEKIENLRKNGSDNIDGAYTGANEWADIIEAIKKNPELMELEVNKKYPSDDNATTLGICYTDPDEKGKAYVTFKGTSGYEEWRDNVDGIRMSDTPAQEAAGEFINGIDKSITDITVVGHSKGANKAMYVTITDKSGANGESRITQCVALDGQGFSYLFLQKYASEIVSRGKIITNYSISTDFVHVLMQQIPFSNQVYCQGYGMTNAGQYHSPASFFVQNEDGSIIFDENGATYFTTGVKEDDSVQAIRRFVAFIMDTCSQEELEEITEFLGPLAGEIIANNNTDAIMGLIKENPKAFGIIVLKLHQFADLYGYNFYDLLNIIATFVFPDEKDRDKCMFIITLVTLIINPLDVIESKTKEVLRDIGDVIKYAYVSLLVAFKAALNYIEKKLIEFKDFLVEAAKSFAKWAKKTAYAIGSAIRDFTEECWSELKGIYQQIVSSKFFNYLQDIAPYILCAPVQFSINIDDEVAAVHNAYNSIDETDGSLLSTVEDIFNKANAADSQYATIINEEVGQIEQLMGSFKEAFQFSA